LMRYATLLVNMVAVVSPGFPNDEILLFRLFFAACK
jgi:hypothetical protein